MKIWICYWYIINKYNIQLNVRKQEKQLIQHTVKTIVENQWISSLNSMANVIICSSINCREPTKIGCLPVEVGFTDNP